MTQLFTVPPETLPQRLDSYLSDNLADINRSQIKRLIENGNVLLNGMPAKASAKVACGDLLSVDIPLPEPVDLIAEEIPLRILFEDQHLLVLDKPAGLVVHPAPGHASGTLVNALLHHCTDLGGINGEMRPGIVHRIDRETSGILVVAKDDRTMAGLSAQFKEHSIDRHYLALVHGLVPPSGSIDQPIGRHPVHRKQMSINHRNGRRAVTHWRTLATFALPRLSLVDVSLETGRTHQIRVHFASLNHHLVGDSLYSKAARDQQIPSPPVCAAVRKAGRHLLHAYRLGFIHPITGEELSFTSPLPPDFAAVLNTLRPFNGQTLTLPTGDLLHGTD